MSRSLVVVGDVLVDRDVEGTVERLSPDAPVPVLDEGRVTTRPGGAGLASVLLALDGHPVTLVTALGDDPAGREAEGLLGAFGVEVVGPRLAGPTPEKIRMMADGRPLLRLDRATSAPPPVTVGGDAHAAIRDASVVVVSDYGRGLLRDEALRNVLELRRRPTLWDPHPRGARPTPGLTLVTPNRGELAAAFPGRVDSLRFVVERSEEARRAWGARAVAATLGPSGVILVEGGGTPLAVPAVPAAGGDPCGAGDRFVTAVAARLHEGALLSEAVADAVAVAGRFVADGGARASLRREPHPAGPPPSPVAAVELANRVRAAGGCVVVAGGCFDLLHAGHVSLLESARRLGDCLIVVLNSDASVQRLKGEGRPLVNQSDRAALLSALSCVDAVAIFDEDDPTAILSRLRPHVFAKGGDYSARRLPETEVLAEWGGQTVVLPYLSGRSTTGLLTLAGSRSAAVSE